MGKIDKIKEQIGWLKVVFGFATAIVVSLTGWSASHYEVASSVEMIFATISVTIFTSVIIWVNKVAYKKMEELEEL